jgi:acetolactate synthase-1/2/3 large subunit
LQEAQAHIAATGLPALIELRYDSELITPNATLDDIRRAAQLAAG